MAVNDLFADVPPAIGALSEYVLENPATSAWVFLELFHLDPERHLVAGLDRYGTPRPLPFTITPAARGLAGPVLAAAVFMRLSTLAQRRLHRYFPERDLERLFTALVDVNALILPEEATISLAYELLRRLPGSGRGLRQALLTAEFSAAS